MKEPKLSETLILGAGRIGTTVAKMLKLDGVCNVTIGDSRPQALSAVREELVDAVRTVSVDCTGEQEIVKAMRDGDIDLVISTLPCLVNGISLNRNVAHAALTAGCSYMDPTEDRGHTQLVKGLSAQAKPGQIFMPQCGLAPGFINITAAHLIRRFDTVKDVRLRVGALSLQVDPPLHYKTTWSRPGVANEYVQSCERMVHGQVEEAQPLEDIEHHEIDDVRLEAANTSGGLGTMCDSFRTIIQGTLDYKSLRYPPHWAALKQMISEESQWEQWSLQKRQDFLEAQLEKHAPETDEDVVFTFCDVTGTKDGKEHYEKDIRRIVGGRRISSSLEPLPAIRTTTAAGICAVVDLMRKGELPDKGFVRQEDVDFDRFMQTPFAKFYE